MKTVKIFALLLSLCFASLGVAHAQTADQNRAALLKAYAAINSHDVNAFGTLLADNFVEYAAPEPVHGKQPSLESMNDYLKAFPDLTIKVEKIIADGTTAMAYVTVTGTWKGEFMNMPPTEKSFKIMDVDIVEFDRTGKATSHKSVQDPMVMMSQISN